jgi:hypothetical protein
MKVFFFFLKIIIVFAILLMSMHVFTKPKPDSFQDVVDVSGSSENELLAGKIEVVSGPVKPSLKLESGRLYGQINNFNPGTHQLALNFTTKKYGAPPAFVYLYYFTKTSSNIGFCFMNIVPIIVDPVDVKEAIGVDMPNNIDTSNSVNINRPNTSDFKLKPLVRTMSNGAMAIGFYSKSKSFGEMGTFFGENGFLFYDVISPNVESVIITTTYS